MLIKTINRIRENINLRLYSNKKTVLRTFQVLGLIVSLVALGSIVYFHGFPRTPGSDANIRLIIKISLYFYVLKYFIYVFYDFHPIRYLKSTWFEGLLMLGIALMGMVSVIWGYHRIHSLYALTSLENIANVYILFVQLYVFVVVIIEIAKASRALGVLHVGPSALLALSFIVLIFGGSGLLMLPEMTTGHYIRFVDALFTSTSASCVTGLVVVETGSFFTFKGQMVILMLIQLGGINIISFATFFATFYMKSSGLRYQSILKDLVAASDISDTRPILQRIIWFSVVIELIGTLSLYLSWEHLLPGDSWQDKAFTTLFHAVSAFNNAGFSLFTNNLIETPIRHAYNSHLIIAMLIFMGGIGFLALQDMASLKHIRQRISHPWRKLQIGTKIAIYTSLFLILFGAVMFYLLEKDNVLKGYSTWGCIVTSIFQAVTPRTAGYNTVDFTRLGQPILFIMVMLMFIGASPGSTGGGIKTTTFTALFKSAFATIRGKKAIELFKHTISFDIIDRAYSVTLFSFVLIFVSTCLLSITESNFSLLSLLFEETSAFATVGLSTGITPYLSDAGKVIIMISMYVGRIGTVTLALALTRKALYTNYRYPTANIMIG